ncbi:MAG: putative immunity protein [Myxococcota bacterium]
MSTTDLTPAALDLLCSSLICDALNNLIAVDAARYTQARELAAAAGLSWSSLLWLLWFTHGERLLFRPSVWFQVLAPDDWARQSVWFACDCAERVLPLFTQESIRDARPYQAIQAARQFIEGEISEHQLYEARAAAQDASRTVSGPASLAAEAAAQSAARHVVACAAWAARYAAQAADANGANEREAQWSAIIDRLCDDGSAHVIAPPHAHAGERP